MQTSILCLDASHDSELIQPVLSFMDELTNSVKMRHSRITNGSNSTVDNMESQQTDSSNKHSTLHNGIQDSFPNPVARHRRLMQRSNKTKYRVFGVFVQSFFRDCFVVGSGIHLGSILSAFSMILIRALSLPQLTINSCFCCAAPQALVDSPSSVTYKSLPSSPQTPPDSTRP